jgi:hypothetical protein
MRSTMKWIPAVLLAFGTTACLDLEVKNENQPDINRALSEPSDVEQVIATSFNIWIGTFNSTDFSRPFTQLADELTSTITTRTVQWSEEPRFPFNNDPQGDPVWIPRRPWDNFSECIANTNDGLRAIKNGMILQTINAGEAEAADNTDRGYVFAKIMQGLCIGTLGLTNDLVAIATEDTVIPQGYDDQRNWEREHLQDHTQMTQVAVNSLEQAIARAETGVQFVTPLTWINQNQYNNQQMIELAHTLIARFLVYSPRTPAERAAVDWQKVLFHTERGLTYDWGVTLQSGIRTLGDWLGLVTNTGSSQFRQDIQYLGGADQSGAYQTWLATPLRDRLPFTIVTPDRRVTGTTPTTNGAYFRYMSSLSIFNVDRGTYNQSHYQWYRRANSAYGGFTSSTGFYAMATADENRLLRAEALIRTGDVAAAIPLINVSRQRTVRVGTTVFAQNLPPLLANGDVPEVNGECVPRRKSGACGDVMDALVWERKMELMGQDPVRTLADHRGLGLLEPGTLVHWPIPGRYLVSLLMPIYTHGGIGGTGAAQ